MTVNLKSYSLSASLLLKVQSHFTLQHTLNKKKMYLKRKTLCRMFDEKSFLKNKNASTFGDDRIYARCARLGMKQAPGAKHVQISPLGNALSVILFLHLKWLKFGSKTRRKCLFLTEQSRRSSGTTSLRIHISMRKQGERTVLDCKVSSLKCVRISFKFNLIFDSGSMYMRRTETSDELIKR